jgi:hypothetical protein
MGIHCILVPLFMDISHQYNFHYPKSVLACEHTQGRKCIKITVFWDMLLCSHRYVPRVWRNLLPFMKFTLKMEAVSPSEMFVPSQKTTILILTTSRISDLTNGVDHLVIGFALGDLCSVL